MSKTRALLLVNMCVTIFLGFSQSDTFAKRKPFLRPSLPKKLPMQASKEGRRFNKQTKEWEEFDRDPKVEFDENRGVYLLSWTNKEGKRKVLVKDPPTKVDVVIESRVEFSPSHKTFMYLYTLHNQATSLQRLKTFNLQTMAETTAITRPDKGWYSSHLTDYVGKALKIGDGRHWADVKYGRLGIPPGQKLTGFSFESTGLPSIVSCYVAGYRTPLTFLDGKPEDLPPGLVDSIGLITWKIPHGVTVGPEDQPEHFSPGDFLEKLMHFVSESLNQGWIESDEVAQEFKVSISRLQAAVEKGDKPGAGEILVDLLIRVESENNKTLLSEAYALMKFNLEFLKTRL